MTRRGAVIAGPLPVIAGSTRNPVPSEIVIAGSDPQSSAFGIPWMPDQVRHDKKGAVIAGPDPQSSAGWLRHNWPA